jgi:hypothetical protein
MIQISDILKIKQVKNPQIGSIQKFHFGDLANENDRKSGHVIYVKYITYYIIIYYEKWKEPK